MAFTPTWLIQGDLLISRSLNKLHVQKLYHGKQDSQFPRVRAGTHLWEHSQPITLPHRFAVRIDSVRAGKVFRLYLGYRTYFSKEHKW